MTPHLTKIAKAMLRRVFVCGNAGYFHDEVAGENWGGRKHSLVVLEKQGLLRSSRAKAPARLLWHLTPDGAQVAQKLWCPGESADRAPEAAAPQPPFVVLEPKPQALALASPAGPAAAPPPRDPTMLDRNQVRLAQARADYQAAVVRAEAAVNRSVALRTGRPGDQHG